MDTYVYPYKDQLYINLTNQCTNNCSFCIRETERGIENYNLWLKKEPLAQDIIRELEQYEHIADVVFCGYGEPTIKLDVLIEVAKYVKQRGGRTRINTNGHANAYHNTDITPRLAPYIDKVSISLNECTAQKYDELCHSIYGQKGFEYMLDFSRACTQQNIDTTLSVVDVISKSDIEQCRSIAKEVGAKLRVRHFEGD